MEYNYNSGKKLIKVLVLLDDFPYTKEIEQDGKKIYKGFFYDIWKKLKGHLTDKYTFEEYYKTQDYKQTYSDISTGKYDIAIAPFASSNYSDKTPFLFSYPIVINSPAILHYSTRNYFSTLFELIKSIFIIPLLIIITLGIIIGFILNYYEPKRFIGSGIKKIHHIRKSFLTIVTTFFGEYGDLIGIKSLPLLSLIFIILILILSLIINVYLQATATDKVIELNSQGSYNLENIVGQKFITEEGYGLGTQFSNWGAKVDYAKDIDNIVKKYLNDPGKYKGVLMSKSAATSAVNKYKYFYPNLKVSYANFGYINDSFPVGNNNIQFLHDLNNKIIYMKQNDEIEDVCKIYSNNIDFNYCLK